MEPAKKIKRFALTETLRAMSVGQVLHLLYRQAAPEVVANAALRLRKRGYGEWEVHRRAGDSTIIRIK